VERERDRRSLQRSSNQEGVKTGESKSTLLNPRSSVIELAQILLESGRGKPMV
jgi:hypothetical protein